MNIDQLKKDLSSRFSAYIGDLEAITNIDSGADSPEGIKKIAEFLAGKLKNMGAETRLLQNSAATHLMARFQGNGKIKLLLLAHMDTVFPVGTAKERPFTMDQDHQAYGPGVGDDKATVIQTLYLMEALIRANSETYDEIIIYYNGQEETGSPETTRTIQTLAQQADCCLVMDTARPNWGIVTERKGLANYRVEVTGKSGHSGNLTQDSASATVELAHQILNIHSLATPVDPTEHKIPPISVNIGQMGTDNRQLNVIPERAYASAEVRAFSLAELNKVDAAIKAFCQKTLIPQTTVNLEGGIETPPMEKNKESRILAQLYHEVVQRAYQAVVWEESAGGVTDGNVTAKYIPTLDGVGVENYAEHTNHERVDLNTFVPRTVVLVLLIEALERNYAKLVLKK